MPRKKRIHLARGLTLPIDYVTETFGFMARRKAGKTYAAQKLAEQMLHVGAQIVVLDPIGNWWSLRLAADGKSPGFDIPVFGGLRGDIPLLRDAGKLIADTVVDTGTSVVLDVSQLSKKAQRAFVADFCEQLFIRRAAEPAAMHVFFEECQSFAPQIVRPGDARMVGAVEDIVRKGRNFGLGASMISQRPQSVNKEIFNQVECLLMMQMRGPHERKTMRDWVDYKGVEAAEIIKELPTLKVGEAWASSPQLGDPVRIKVEKKETFDASSAPMVGSRKRAKKLHKLDLAKLETAMASVIEEAAANDPGALRKRVTELERELAQAAAATPAADVEEADRLRGDLATAEAEIESLERTLAQMRSLAAVVSASASELADGAEKVARLEPVPLKLPKKRTAPVRNGVARRVPQVSGQPRTIVGMQDRPSRSPGPVNGSLAPADQVVLDALAWWDAVGIPEPTRLQLAFVCGVHHRTKSHTNRVSQLRSSGLLDYPDGGRVSLTDKGRSLANFPSAPGTTRDLHEMVLARLAPADRDVLQPALDRYPDALTREDLAAICGVHPKTKSHTNRISKLKTLGVLCYPRNGVVQASSAMFVSDKETSR